MKFMVQGDFLSASCLFVEENTEEGLTSLLSTLFCRFLQYVEL